MPIEAGADNSLSKSGIPKKGRLQEKVDECIQQMRQDFETHTLVVARGNRANLTPYFKVVYLLQQLLPNITNLRFVQKL